MSGSWTTPRFCPVGNHTVCGWSVPRFACDEFKEENVKRDEDGKFASSAGGQTTISNELRESAIQNWKEQPENRDKVYQPPTDKELKRWVVNYARHKLTDYDEAVEGVQDYKIMGQIRQHAYSGIVDKWPELREESLAQLHEEKKHPDLELLPPGTARSRLAEISEPHKREIQKRKEERERKEAERRARLKAEQEERDRIKQEGMARHMANKEKWAREKQQAGDSRTGWASPRF